MSLPPFQQPPRKKNLTSRLLKPEIEKFISNRNHILTQEVVSTIGEVNPSGFVQVLRDGMKSTDRETLEVNVNEVDLSIRQNGGFSIFFWLITSKVPGVKSTYNILKKGNTVDQFTPTIGLSNGQTNLFITLSTSKSKKETIYANKSIDKDHFYSVAVTFLIHYDEEFTEVSIFLDGKLDTQTTIQGEPIHNQGNVYIGKPDSTSHGFKGTIADIVIVPGVIMDDQVKIIHESGLESIAQSKGTRIETERAFKNVFERVKLIKKYALYTGKPIYAIANMNLSNDKMREVVKNYDEEERKNDVKLPPIKRNIKEENMLRNMEMFLSNEDNEIRCNKIQQNNSLINTIFFLANNGENNMEVERMGKIMGVLADILLVDIDQDFLYQLGKILNAVVSKIYINTKDFFLNLENSLKKLEEIRVLKEQEDAKYQMNERKHNKSIKSMYGSKKATKKKTRTFCSDTQCSSVNQEEIRSFGNCIPEHERLILNMQKMRNTVDLEQERDLNNYQSSFVIKTLYEKPKNLPGENPSQLEPSINFLCDATDQGNDSIFDNETQKMLTPEEQEIILKNLDDIFEIEGNDERLVKLEKIETKEQGEEAKKIAEAQKEKERKIREEEERKLHEKEDEEKNNEDSQAEEEVKIKYSFDPVIPEKWSEGNFEVVINHCYDCHKHTTTTRHYEFTFVDKFNDIGTAIKNVFPNSTIIGNLDMPEYLSNFDVYLRGTGLPSDERGKYYIYSKRDTKKFPSTYDVVDKLITLAVIYGSSLNVESAQKNDLDECRIEITHDHPASLSPEAEKVKTKLTTKKEEEKIDPERTPFACVHWGCTQEFVQNKNTNKSCQYHPGNWQFGSYKQNWPECWTCCEGKWDDPGCTFGKHEGVVAQKRVFLCLNHGELNPKTGRPDSACGARYTIKSDDGCKYHSGYLNGRKVWTCCGGDDGAAGCVEGKHATELYPNEKAKLYFLTRIDNNPGLKYNKNEPHQQISTRELIKQSEYFKEAMPYPDYKQRAKEQKERRENEPDKVRYCLNFGCKVGEYVVKENGPKKCKCHPGKWDHGNSGTTMEEYINGDGKKVLWKPHWTCCGGTWESEPCKQCCHRGPYAENVTEKEKEIRWPDIRVKMRFRKIVSDKWIAFLEQYQYSEKKVRRIIKKADVSSIDGLPRLLDKLRLYLLVNQEDPSYSIKYFDVINRENSVDYFCDKNGQIDKEKFINWWKWDYIKIYEEMHPPPKEEKKEEENKDGKPAEVKK